MITLGPTNFGMPMSEGKEKDLTGHLGVTNIQKVTETILDSRFHIHFLASGPFLHFDTSNGLLLLLLLSSCLHY